MRPIYEPLAATLAILLLMLMGCEPPPAQYQLAVSVSGLNGGTVVLDINGNETLSVNADGSHFFPTALNNGDSYIVIVENNPADQQCVVAGGFGVIDNGQSSAITVSCADDTPPQDFYSIGWTMSIGGPVDGLTLDLNGTEALVWQPGVYNFNTELNEGDTYVVTIAANPENGVCHLWNGTGVVSGNVDDIMIFCSAETMIATPENFPDWQFADCINDLRAESFSQVTTLDCYWHGIKDATGVEFLTQLSELDLGLNDITSIDLSNNIYLSVLSLPSNELTSIDISNNTALTSLNLHSNNLSDINISSNSALTFLHLAANNLSDINISSNSALTFLHLGSNNFSDIDLSNNPLLEKAYLERNQFTNLNVSANTQLRWLYLDDNFLTGIDVSNNLDLDRLILRGNSITSIDVSNNIELTELHLPNNLLTTMNLDQNVNLNSVALGGNPFDAATVAYLEALKASGTIQYFFYP